PSPSSWKPTSPWSPPIPGIGRKSRDARATCAIRRGVPPARQYGLLRGSFILPRGPCKLRDFTRSTPVFVGPGERRKRGKATHRPHHQRSSLAAHRLGASGLGGQSHQE